MKNLVFLLVSFREGFSAARSARTVRIEIKLFCFRVNFSVARMARMESLDSKNFVVTEDNYAAVEEFDEELTETTAVVQVANI